MNLIAKSIIRIFQLTGEYSCLRVDLLFKREFSYYLIQIYIPCCMLVIVSWVSFWLDQSAVPARVSLGVTTLLTMATQTSGINASLPPVSYTKAIDVWTGVCLTFVFGALLEFALVNYASRSDSHREKLKNENRAAAATTTTTTTLEDGNAFQMVSLVYLFFDFCFCFFRFLILNNSINLPVLFFSSSNAIFIA